MTTATIEPPPEATPEALPATPPPANGWRLRRKYTPGKSETFTMAAHDGQRGTRILLELATGEKFYTYLNRARAAVALGLEGLVGTGLESSAAVSRLRVLRGELLAHKQRLADAEATLTGHEEARSAALAEADREAVEQAERELATGRNVLGQVQSSVRALERLADAEADAARADVASAVASARELVRRDWFARRESAAARVLAEGSGALDELVECDCVFRFGVLTVSKVRDAVGDVLGRYGLDETDITAAFNGVA
jgi:hypothetical protein